MAVVSEEAIARRRSDSLQTTGGKPRGLMEHRWGHRYAADLSVSFALRSGLRGTGRLLNISTTGAYLHTEMPLRILTLIELFIDGFMPRGVRFTACVIRRDQGGFGLEWETPIRPIREPPQALLELADGVLNRYSR
jgi:hypothetical protein